MFLLIETCIWVVITLFLLLTLLPLSKYPHGLVRTAEFPRIQIVVISLMAMPIAYWSIDDMRMWWAMALLAVIAIVQAGYIIPFTPIWHRQSLRADDALMAEPDCHVSFVAANVKMSNDAYGRLLKVIEDSDPDIVMLLEVNDDWINAMEDLREQYGTVVERPHGNGYGMALYSKLKLFDTEVRELLVEDVPSIRTGVELPSGDQFRLYVLHPEPPIPSHDTEGRDSEITMIGIEAKEDEFPAIVSGDLNDVAWSSTTRRFQRLSKLLDPRVGRGFFNTFDARFPFMRWPLDHLFHDPRFQLIKLERLPKIGSDHFPIFFHVALARSANADEMPDDSSEEERQEVEQMIDREKQRDREAIGSDWED